MDRMSDPLWVAMIEQFNFERFSAEVYESMGWMLDAANLVGFGRYMRQRGAEERQHAVRFAQYMSDRNLNPVYKALSAPPPIPAWSVVKDAPLACVRAALGHEQAVTMRIHALYTIAEESDDPSACVFLHWFIQEQVEEEASLDELITRLELAAECTSGLLAIDAEFKNALAG